MSIILLIEFILLTILIPALALIVLLLIAVFPISVLVKLVKDRLYK